MDEIRIVGGTSLCGEVSVQGSKNAALPMMAASLLFPGVSVLKGCPKISDVFCMERILQALGAESWWENHDLYLDCSKAEKTVILESDTKQMRSSVILLGPLLGRNQKASMGYPGGCVIGTRPIDLHLLVLGKMGAVIKENREMLSAECTELKGCPIVFRQKSVGATEQGILAAVLAKGETCLQNCACEPEIQHLCRYLRGMGAEISGDGTECIVIKGVTSLRGGNMQVPSDRIVAGTYICAAAVTKGKLVISNAPYEEMTAFLEVYQKIGGQYKVKSGKLIVNGKKVGHPLEFLETEVYPGYPTDLQSQMTAVLATVPGKSHIRENIFENRFRILEQLRRMGAKLEVSGKDIWIDGGKPLFGCEVSAQELRGGAALMLAALAAEGTTILRGYSYICRGYETICEDLTALGGNITKNTGRV